MPTSDEDKTLDQQQAAESQEDVQDTAAGDVGDKQETFSREYVEKLKCPRFCSV